MSPQDTVEALLAAAVEAAAIIREVYETPFKVDWKGPRDPVTEADRRANEALCARLGAAFPGVPVVAEESAPEAFAGYAASERVFFVDPLDGTNEFIARNGEFVVMVGLVEGERPTVGVILAPDSGIAWCGATGLGAFEVTASGVRRPLRVSAVSELSRARLVTTRSHRTPELERALAHLGVAETRALGSAGLKAVAVALGEAEAYAAPGYAGKRWDACAPEAVVSAAGGRLTDVTGVALDYRAPSLVNDRGLLATNGLLHDALVQKILTL